MVKTSFFYLCLCMVTIILTSGCSKGSGNVKDSQDIAIELEPVEINEESGNLAYYGFALVNTYVDDNSDSSRETNYTDEVQDFTNMVDLVAVDPEQDISLDLEYNQSHGLTNLIHCFELFFERIGKDSQSGNQFALREDYKNRFLTFYEGNNLKDYDVILYIGEEPLWNGLSNDAVNEACDYIKTVNKDLKAMVIEAYPVVTELKTNGSVDYLGFDQYFIMDPIENEQYMANLEYLENNLLEHQSIFLVIDTHYIDRAHYNHGQIHLDEMGQVAANYYDLARDRENVIGLIGYFWPSGFDDESAVGGARGMPGHVQEVYRSIGQAIIVE